jgi:hypothetical protein
MYCEAIRPQTNCGFFSNSSGPGRRPHIISPPSMIAVVAEPGMPRVSIGTIAPVAAALFADSGRRRPRSRRCRTPRVLRDLLLDRVREEGRDRRAGAGQDADEKAEHGAARDRPAALAQSRAVGMTSRQP